MSVNDVMSAKLIVLQVWLILDFMFCAPPQYVSVSQYLRSRLASNYKILLWKIDSTFSFCSLMSLVLHVFGLRLSIKCLYVHCVIEVYAHLNIGGLF